MKEHKKLNPHTSGDACLYRATEWVVPSCTLNFFLWLERVKSSSSVLSESDVRSVEDVEKSKLNYSLHIIML